MKYFFSLLIISLVLGLIGCASSSSEPETGGDELVAPVRESSIIAPEIPKPVIVEAGVEQIEVVEKDEESFSQIEILSQHESIEISTTESVVVEALEDAQTSEVLREDTVVVVTEQKDTEPLATDVESVEGLVQLELPETHIETPAEAEESDVAAYLLDEAENSFERQNYERAKGQAERALSVEPTAGRAYVILSRIALVEDQPEQAAETARQGLASASDSEEIFEQLNQILGEIAEMLPVPSSDLVPQPLPETNEDVTPSSQQ